MRALVAIAIVLAAFSFTGIASADETQKKEDASPTSSQLIIAGVGALAVGYGYAATAAGVYRTPDDQVPSSMFVPVVGPYVALAEGQIPVQTLIGARAANAYFRNHEGPATFEDVSVFMGGLVLGGLEYTLLVLDPILQGAGLAATTVGIAESGKKPALPSSTTKISFAPMWSSGPGVAMQVTSW
jgi:hypothetical protein